MPVTSVELIEEMSLSLGMNESTCANSYKEIRAANLVTNKGRGRHAARMTARDAVMLLFAVCGSEHVKDSVDAARRYSALGARSVEGNGDRGRQSEDTTWRLITGVFPYLAALNAHHTLLDATVALVTSYRDDAIVSVPNQLGITPLVKLSVRGPTPSATIAISTIDMPEEAIEYRPLQALDMFRTILDENPLRQRKKMLRGTGDLRIEKHISHTTLKRLGEILRE
jgi:hypothetical protein